MRTPLLTLLFFAHIVRAGIISYAPLPIIERQASSIIVAEVESVAATPTRSTIVVRVVRTVNGVERRPGTLENLWVESDLLDAAAAKNYGPRLWFIGPDGAVIPRTVNVPRVDGLSLPAVRDDRYQDAARAATARGLGIEIAAAARDRLLDAPAVRQVTHYLQSRSVGEREELERLGFSQVSADSLRVANLLRSGVAASVDELVRQLGAGAPDHSVRDALCSYRNPSSAGIAALSKLLDSTTDTGLAVCALVALKEIHTNETIPVLARALDRPDESQRYLVVSGLYFAANAGQVPMEKPFVVDGREVQRPKKGSGDGLIGELPPFDVYRLEEAKHLAFWRTWASTTP